MFLVNTRAKFCKRLGVALLALSSMAIAGTVSVSSPTSGQSVASPFHVVASATSSTTVTAVQVYVDGSLVKSVTGSTLDAYISASTGSRKLTVKGWDKSGANFSKYFYITVTSSSSTSTAPSGSTVYSNIDQMTGWGSCTKCAGAGGSGTTAPYSLQIGVNSPSIDGKAAQFNLGGSTPYSDALWWKQLGANSSVHNFVYDLNFYVKNPTAPQALEFDVNQGTGGHKYIFGTECGYRTTGNWKVWNYAKGWQDTGVHCGSLKAYAWNHLTWEFQRTSDGHVKFVAVTLNGTKSYINRAYWPQSSSTNEVNVAFQMDGNYAQADYSVWLDKVKLTYW